MTKKNHPTIQFGPYGLTPLVKSIHTGKFFALLSVRRGQGRQSNDCVYTFIPEFLSREAALRYAVRQMNAWLSNPQVFC